MNQKLSIADKCKITLSPVAEAQAKELESLSHVELELLNRGLLPHRKQFVDRLRARLEEISKLKTPSLTFIRGEWGEGKTAAYKLVIEPYAKEKGMVVRYTNVIYALNYLEKLAGVIDFDNYAELFTAILLYDPDAFEQVPQRAIDIVIHSLSKDIKDTKADTVIIFVDEIEEILRRGKDELEFRSKNIRLKIEEVVIRWLRETPRTTESSFFEKLKRALGRDVTIHYIIATTPYAYIKLFSNLEIVELGKIARTVSVLDLRSLSRVESYIVVKNLIENLYCKGHNLYEVLSDPRLVLTLHKISHGNIGALVSLLNVLISSVSQESVVDPTKFVEALTGYKIYVSIGQVEALSQSVLSALKSVIKGSKELRELLYKILSLGVLVYDDLKGKVTELELLKLRIKMVFGLREEPIISVKLHCLASNSEGFAKLRAVLNEIARKVHTYLNLDMATIERAFENLAIILKSGEMEDVCLLLPDTGIPEKDAEILTRLISREEVLEIQPNVWNDIVESVIIPNTVKILKGMALSPSLEELVYPIPVVEALKILREKDLSKGLELWRHAYQVLSSVDASYYVSHTLRTILMNVDFGPDIKIDPVHTHIKEEKNAVETKVIYADATIDVLIGIVVRKPDFEQIEEKYLRLLRYPYVLILAIDHEYNDVVRAIESKEYSKLIKIDVINIPQYLFIYMILYQLALDKRLPLDSRGIEEFLHNIANRIHLAETISRSIKELVDKGIIVAQPVVDILGSLDRIISAYSILLLGLTNENENVVDIDTAAELFIKIAFKYRLYGRHWRNRPAILGIDLETIDQVKSFFRRREILDVLRRNKLIEIGKDEIIILTLHPVENRILELLRSEKCKNGCCTVDTLTNFFIGSETLLRNYFMQILSARGRISIFNNTICLQTRDALVNRITAKISKLRKLIEDINQKLGLIAKELVDRGFSEEVRISRICAHLGMVKEKGHLLLTLNDIETLLNFLEQGISESRFSMPQLAIFSQLLDYITETIARGILKPGVDELVTSIERLLDKVEKLNSMISDFAAYVKKETINRIELAAHSHKITLEYEISNVRAKVDEFLGYLTASDDELQKTIEESLELDRRSSKRFSFRARPEEAYYFNVVLYKISEILDDLNRIEHDYRNRIDTIKNRCRMLVELYVHCTRLVNELPDVDARSQIKTEIAKLMNGIAERFKFIGTFDDLENLIKDLHKAVDKYYQDLSNRVSEIRQRKARINDLKKRADSYSKAIEDIEKTFKTLRKFYEAIQKHYHSPKLDSLSSLIQEIEFRLSQVKQMIEKLRNTLSVVNISNLDKYDAELRLIDDRLSNGVATLQQKTRELHNHLRRQIDNILQSIRSLVGFCENRLRDRWNAMQIIYEIKDAESSLNGAFAYYNIDLFKKSLEKLSNLSEQLKSEIHDVLKNLLTGLISDERVDIIAKRLLLLLASGNEIDLHSLDRELGIGDLERTSILIGRLARAGLITNVIVRL